MEYAILIAPCAALLALGFALFFARRVLKMPEREETRGIAAVIRRSANAFLKRQYAVVAVFFLCVFIFRRGDHRSPEWQKYNQNRCKNTDFLIFFKFVKLF